MVDQFPVLDQLIGAAFDDTALSRKILHLPRTSFNPVQTSAIELLALHDGNGPITRTVAIGLLDEKQVTPIQRAAFMSAFSHCGFAKLKLKPHTTDKLFKIERDRLLKEIIDHKTIDAMNTFRSEKQIDLYRALSNFSDNLKGLDRLAQSPADLSVWEMDDLVANNMEQGQPIIDGLLREAEIMNLVAASKSRKSWLIMQLAICIAQGKPWLGRFQCTAAPVLLIDNELRLPTLRARAKAIYDAQGLTVSKGVKLLPVRGCGFELNDVEQYIAKTNAQVVILDALYRFFPAKFDENSNADMTRLYNHLDTIATKTGAAIIVVHHASKGGQTLKAVTDVGSGAGAQSRAADAHVVLRPIKADADQAREQRAYLDAMNRSFPPIPRLEIEWRYPLWLPVDPLEYTPDPDNMTTEMAVNTYFSNQWEQSTTIREKASLSNSKWENIRNTALKLGFVEMKPEGKFRLYRKVPQNEESPF